MKKIIIVLFLVALLSACSGEEKQQYHYTFKGEGEYWEAEYVVKGTETWRKKYGITKYSNEDHDELLLTYKGTLEDLSSIESLEYAYETSAGGGGRFMEFDEPPTNITFKSEGGGSGAKIRKDEIIQLYVKWDSHEEIFELHNIDE